MTENKNLAINGGKPVTATPVIIHKPYMDEDDFQAIDKTARTTFISGNGPDCMALEKKMREYYGVKHVLFTNSCTTALDLIFKAMNFPAGSEVIVPNFTYTSTALGPLLNNLKIVLADVYPENGNIDVTKIEKLITPKTVAIMPVDYAGNPADMDPVMELAKKHKLFVAQDSAQSIGAYYKNRKVGTLADATAFSFHGTKNITTGEGGALLTNNDDLAERAMLIREKGTNKQSFLMDNKTRGFYEYESLGSSFVQSNILGALGVSQFNKLEQITKVRKEIAEFYLENLKGIDGLDFIEHTPNSITNWHIFGILVKPELKYWVMDALRAEGIMCNVHYTPLHRNKYYKDLTTDELAPGSMKFYDRLLRLPIYPSLTQNERKLVVEAVKKVFNC